MKKNSQLAFTLMISLSLPIAAQEYGTPDKCTKITDQNACKKIIGCSWQENKCQHVCTNITTNQTDCEKAGCRWEKDGEISFCSAKNKK